MDVKKCFEKRLLRRIPVDKEKVKSSFSIAENKLHRAKDLLGLEFYQEAITSAYTSMFHSARALLYSDGIQEKGHYAVYIYLSEKYSKHLGRDLVGSFYYYQKERHEILYGFEESFGEEETKSVIEDAERFLVESKKWV